MNICMPRNKRTCRTVFCSQGGSNSNCLPSKNPIYETSIFQSGSDMTDSFFSSDFVSRSKIPALWFYFLCIISAMAILWKVFELFSRNKKKHIKFSVLWAMISSFLPMTFDTSLGLVFIFLSVFFFFPWSLFGSFFSAFRGF